MDAGGAIVNRDGSSPPYNSTHQLETNQLPQTGSYVQAHQSTVEDVDTPLDGGAPAFESTWLYLMGP